MSGFGPRVPVSEQDTNLLERFAVSLAVAMLHDRIGRVVVESVAFLFKDSIIPPTYLLGRLSFPGVVADSRAMELVAFMVKATEEPSSIHKIVGLCN